MKESSFEAGSMDMEFSGGLTACAMRESLEEAKFGGWVCKNYFPIDER